jgi:hypothetical protein
MPRSSTYSLFVDTPKPLWNDYISYTYYNNKQLPGYLKFTLPKFIAQGLYL